jgi:DNA-binding NtrC family response regulator
MKNLTNPASFVDSRTPVARDVRHGLERTQSSEMRNALDTMRRVAGTDLSVLIVGEQGSGREWAAHTIHQMSRRREGPFYVLDCGTIHADQLERELFGYETISWNGIDAKRSGFEEAAGGTLVIEEIEGLPPHLQAKIAHAVEYRTIRHIGGETNRGIDTRVIATLSTGEQHGTPASVLHQDLLHRFSPIMIQIPPLRKRKEDIVMLIDTFLEELRMRHGCAVQGISSAAVETCEEFDWPGNLRQLRSAIEYASVMSDGKMIETHHLPPYVTAKDSYGPLRH